MEQFRFWNTLLTSTFPGCGLGGDLGSAVCPQGKKNEAKCGKTQANSHSTRAITRTTITSLEPSPHPAVAAGSVGACCSGFPVNGVHSLQTIKWCGHAIFFAVLCKSSPQQEDKNTKIHPANFSHDDLQWQWQCPARNAQQFWGKWEKYIGWRHETLTKKSDFFHPWTPSRERRTHEFRNPRAGLWPHCTQGL